MGLRGEGVLAIWNGIAPEAEEEFVAWHVREHIPERVAVPGFLRGRRYAAEAGRPAYFNFYETENAATLTSRAYLDRLNAPSDWTRSVVRHFRDTTRTACSVEFSIGAGDGGHIGTLRLSGGSADWAAAGRLGGSLGDAISRVPGVVATHLLRGMPSAAGPTAETALRNRPDGHAPWILLIETVGHEAVDRAFGGPASASALAAFGFAAADGDRGVYRLQYALSRDQLT